VILVSAFMFAAPGSLALSWYPHLPVAVRAGLVPALSLAMCLVLVTGLLMLGFYLPTPIWLGATIATVVMGLLRCRYLAKSEVETDDEGEEVDAS
jgi:hypothetical protein